MAKNLNSNTNSSLFEDDDFNIILISNDGEAHEVSSRVACLSKVIEETIQCNELNNDDENENSDNEVPDDQSGEDNINFMEHEIERDDTNQHQHQHQHQHSHRRQRLRQAQPLQEVHLPNVRSACLSKVIEFCAHFINVEPMEAIHTPLHGNGRLEDNVSQTWYKDFVNLLDISMVFELVAAANYMDIKPLLDLTCLVVTVHLHGKSAEQIRVALNIPEMTPEEKQRAMMEHKWIFGD